jgi:hypothetical protein
MEDKSLFKKLDLKTLLILGLMIFLFFSNITDSCNSQTSKNVVKIDGKKYEVVKHTVDTIYIPKITTVYKPGKTIWRSLPQPGKPPKNLDTLKIVEDFYSTYVYKDTLTLDNHLGIINITDTITQNQIKGRNYKATIIQKTIYDTKIVKELPKDQIYIGGISGFDKTNIINFVGPSVLYKTKQDRIFFLAAGYGTDKNVSIQGGMYWKISLHK